MYDSVRMHDDVVQAMAASKCLRNVMKCKLVAEDSIIAGLFFTHLWQRSLPASLP